VEILFCCHPELVEGAKKIVTESGAEVAMEKRLLFSGSLRLGLGCFDKLSMTCCK